MRVLLVLPKSHHWFKHMGDIPPLGLAYISSALRRDGHETAIWDENLPGVPKPDLTSFDCVGISTDTIRYSQALRLASMAKAAGRPVVLGGSHASFLDREALATGLVDYVVRNEGEEIVRELCSRLEGGGDLSEVRGLSYLDGGAYRRNDDAPFPQDLDSLAWPDREELFAHGRYRRNMMGRRPFTTMIASRGCPYTCEFCSSPRLSGKTRYRNVVDVVDEMEDIVRRFRFGTIVFTDDIFTVNPKRVHAMCDEIGKRRLDVKWWCCSRVDTVMRQRELFRHMKEAGCYTVFLGIDGGTDEALAEHGKGYKADIAYDAIHFLQSIGIEVNAAFILGGIHETRAQMMQTIRYAKALRPETAQFTINTPLPGADLWDRVQDRIEDRNWDHYDLFHAVMRLDSVKSRHEVERLLLRAYASFYLLSAHGLRNLFTFVKERVIGPQHSRSYGEPLSSPDLQARVSAGRPIVPSARAAAREVA